MNRPSFFTYLFGNRFSCFAILAFTALLAVLWWTGGQQAVPWQVVLVAMFCSSGALNANGRIVAFENWKREWEAAETGGKGVDARASKLRHLRDVCAVLVWIALAWIVGVSPPSEVKNYVVFVFVVINLAISYRLIRWLRPKRSKPIVSELDHVVSVCVPIPAESQHAPTVSALPQYCVSLLNPIQH